MVLGGAILQAVAADSAGYDGLGRIVRKEQRESSSNTQVRIEDYYYDGVRRIQDVIMRPNAVPPPPPCSDEPVTKGGEEEEWKGEDGESKGDELPPCKKGNPQQTVTTTTYQTWTDREYVYGPGDVNEFVCQLDANGNPLYPLQDGNLNVVGLTDGGGNLLRQDVYGPYGELIATDLFTQQPADNKIGFQGMFFDRLTTSAQDNQLSPGGLGLYRTANRSYNPDLGRWLQRDPNATAQPIVEAAAYNARSMTSFGGMFEVASLYGDGANLYGFARSNPLNGRDPLGLSESDFDYMEEADDIIMEHAAEVTAFMTDIYESAVGVARAAVWGAATAAASALVPGLGLALAAIGTADAATDIWENGLSTGSILALAANVAGGKGDFLKVMKLLKKFRNRFAASSALSSRGAQDFRPRNTWHKGVWFDDAGYPDFSPHAIKDVEISPTSTRIGDSRAANMAAGYDSTPRGYRWHHHQDHGRMQLVPEGLHDNIGHDGGWRIWGGGEP